MLPLSDGNTSRGMGEREKLQDSCFHSFFEFHDCYKSAPGRTLPRDDLSLRSMRPEGTEARV